MKKYLIFILICLLTSHIYPYEVNNHKIITICTINLLRNIYGKEFITDQEMQLIIEGNINEDKPGIDKLWDQHFYNPIKSKEFWKRNHSIDKRYNKLVEKFLVEKGNKELSLVGAITHHLQDATCPAHVVPIFHWVGKPDKFDYLNIDSLLPKSFDNFTVDKYSDDYANIIHFMTAKQTLDNITQRFIVIKLQNGYSTKDTIDWSFFWKDNPKGWFGDYGLLGKPTKKQNRKITDNYLKEEITVNDCTYKISKLIYDNFARQQLSIAVTRTAEFIYYYKMRENK